MTRGILSLLAVIALLLAGCSRGSDSPSGTPAVVAKSVPTVLILDASGSMTEADAPGPRIDAAKTAAHGLLQALPDDSTLGLLTYGTATGSADTDKPAGCNDVRTLIPLGALDRTAMGSAIDAITPSGYTPISLALQTGADALPDGDTAIVLVSDGEDTCDTPPCDTATGLKQTHPGLTISTVGFKVDGTAADQLRCIAETTGGVIVQAANADQLAARLLATQNIDQANQSLSATGIYGINLGTNITDIRTTHPDFPDATTTGTVTVIWKDCDFEFTDNVLTSIAPHNGGRTIDGITTGTPIAQAVTLYGQPLDTTPNGTHATVYFDTGAANTSDAAYKMDIDDYAKTSGGEHTGTIKTIVLCRCKPQAAPAVTGPEEIVLKPVDKDGNLMPGFAEDDSLRNMPMDCTYGSASRYDVTGGVVECGSSADMGDACWPTQGGSYLLCLQDPFQTTLKKRPTTNYGSMRPRTEPARPIGIELEDGTTCRARLGGSWSAQEQHPDYYGAFYCQGGTIQADYVAVWSPPGSDDGITKNSDGWTVEVGGSKGPLTTLKVTKAYYVGIA